MSSNDTPELKHFTKHHDDLTEALSKNPWQVANVLWKEGFISSITMDSIKIQVYTHNYKAELLFKALCAKIRRDPLDFHRLLDVLFACGLSEALISNLRLVHHSKGKYVAIHMLFNYIHLFIILNWCCSLALSV